MLGVWERVCVQKHFIWKGELQSESDREYSIHGFASQTAVTAGTGHELEPNHIPGTSGSPMWVALVSSAAAFPVTLAGSCIRSGAAGAQTCAHKRWWYCRQWLHSLCHNAATLCLCCLLVSVLIWPSLCCLEILLDLILAIYLKSAGNLLILLVNKLCLVEIVTWGRARKIKGLSTHVGDLDGAPGFWFQPDPVQLRWQSVALRPGQRGMGEVWKSSPFRSPFCNSAFQISQYIFLKKWRNLKVCWRHEFDILETFTLRN